MSDVNITLTQEECDVIRAILYSIIGGDTKGPREIVEQIMCKVPESHPNPFTATIEEVNRMGSLAGVVRRKHQKKTITKPKQRPSM